MITVMGFDPGETSGYCIIDYPHDNKIPLEDFSEDYVVDDGEIPLWNSLDKLINQYEPNVIVCEAFKLYPWKAKQQSFSSFPTVETIGVLKYILEDKPEIKLLIQGADKKKFYSDKKLKRLGVYDGISRHTRDSLRHALHYLTHNR